MGEGQEKPLPDWAAGALDQFLENAQRHHNFFHLTIQGLRVIIHYDNRVDTLEAEIEASYRKQGLGSPARKTDDKSRSAARKIAEQAKKEVQEGFPVLCQQQIVSYWSELESFIEDVVVALLVNQPAAMKCEQIRKIKVSLSDFNAMVDTERIYYLVSEMQRDLKPPRRFGIDKSEALLDIFGLSGSLDPNIRREFIEMESIRNVLLHRRGIADTKLVETCPWLSVRVGERVPTDELTVTRYVNAVFDYVSLIVDRIKSYSAAQMPREGSA